MASTNQTIRIIELKDKINTICQVSKYQYPVHFNLPMHRQKIPVVLIGKIQFVAQNWLCDEKTRVVKLCEQVLENLESQKFIELNIENLTAFTVEYPKLFADDDELIVIQSI